MGLTRRTKHYVILRLDRAMEVSELRAQLQELSEQLDRQATQLAAVEERLADLREAATDRREDDESMSAARAADDHRRLRARMGVVTNYVQRLDALESAVFGEPSDADGDPPGLET